MIQQIVSASVLAIATKATRIACIRRFAVVSILMCATVSGASASVSLHESVVALYSFSPHLITKEEQVKRSKDLDAFWSSIKTGGAGALAGLREELARADSSPYFSYDGAKLLLSLSKSSADRALALKSIERADLSDIQYDDYFWTIHEFSVDGMDTTEAAFKILGDDKFKVDVPQHALILDQEMSFLYLLLPTKEAYFLERAEQRLFSETSVVAQKSLLTLIGSTVTKSGDDAIARFAAAPEQPEESRNYAQKIIKTTRDMESIAILGLSVSSYESLKEDQRKLFGRVSDEALGEWEHLRLKIRHRGPR